MITITLKDGSKKKYKKNITVIDVAKDISEGFARNVLSASFNGKTVEVSTHLNESGSLELYSWNDNEGKKHFGILPHTYLHKPWKNYILR